MKRMCWTIVCFVMGFSVVRDGNGLLECDWNPLSRKVIVWNNVELPFKKNVGALLYACTYSKKYINNNIFAYK